MKMQRNLCKCGCGGSGQFIDHVHSRKPYVTPKGVQQTVRQFLKESYNHGFSEFIFQHAAMTITGGQLLDEIYCNHPEYTGDFVDINDLLADKTFCNYCRHNWFMDTHQLDAFLKPGSRTVIDIKSISTTCERVIGDVYSGAI